ARLTSTRRASVALSPNVNRPYFNSRPATHAATKRSSAAIPAALRKAIGRNRRGPGTAAAAKITIGANGRIGALQRYVKPRQAPSRPYRAKLVARSFTI